MELEGSLVVHTVADNSLRVVVLVGREEAGWYAWRWWSRAEGSPGLTPLATSSAMRHREVFCKQSWRGWVFVAQLLPRAGVSVPFPAKCLKQPTALQQHLSVLVSQEALWE